MFFGFVFMASAVYEVIRGLGSEGSQSEKEKKQKQTKTKDWKRLSEEGELLQA